MDIVVARCVPKEAHIFTEQFLFADVANEALIRQFLLLEIVLRAHLG
jgi:hypothetical protein